MEIKLLLEASPVAKLALKIDVNLLNQHCKPAEWLADWLTHLLRHLDSQGTRTLEALKAFGHSRYFETWPLKHLGTWALGTLYLADSITLYFNALFSFWVLHFIVFILWFIVFIMQCSDFKWQLNALSSVYHDNKIQNLILIIEYEYVKIRQQEVSFWFSLFTV